MSRSFVRRHARPRMILWAFVLSAPMVGLGACGSEHNAAPLAAEDGGTEDDPLLPEKDGQSDAAAEELDAASMNLDAPGDEVEAAVRTDGGEVLAPDESCRGTNPCDCDNDGYEGVGEGCSGEDCDDRDPLRFPGQTFVAVKPEDGKDGNWDCSDPIEKQYATNLSCGLLGLLLCTSGTQGFTSDPPCGTEAPFYQCSTSLVGLNLTCAPVEVGKRRQGCR